VEILVTLVIMSFVMVGSGVAFQKTSPRWALDNTKVQLLVDLKRARSTGKFSHENIILTPLEFGYEIDQLNIIRKFPRHVQVRWPVEGDNGEILINQLSIQADIEFILYTGSEQTSIIVERITGRIYERS